MFEPSNSTNFEQGLFEDANKVQVGNITMPKLNVSNLPQGHFTWSPKSSDSGETETDDISNQHESMLNSGAHNNSRAHSIHEENSFFNLPANPSDLQELEQHSGPSSVFDFNRSLRSSPLSEDFQPGSSYPPSTHFKPSSYEGHSHFPSELGYEPVRSMTSTPPAGGVDPKVC